MNDGGPAFPVPISKVDFDTRPEDFDATGCGGMSLRDYFAAKAMQAFIQNFRPEADGMGYILPSQWRPVVSGAWKIADEMLAEREKAK